ncbi:MAG: NADPH-dependent FMN reductase [Sphaerimonospora mesophila]
MKKVLVVIGSARKGRVADKVTALVNADLGNREDITVETVDLAELKLPFFDNEHAPSNPDYKVENEIVREWGNLVSGSDIVVLVTPEYNHNLSAIEKNAIDSLFAEWNDKSVIVVSYGWSGGSKAVAAIRELAPVVKMNLESTAELFFMKDLQLDGTMIDGGEATSKVAAALDVIS